MQAHNWNRILLQRHPALYLTPLLGFFYYNHLAHLPLSLLLPVLLPALGGNYLVIHLLWRRVVGQIRRERVPWWELLIALLLPLLVLYTDFFRGDFTFSLPLMLVILFLWLVWQVRRKALAYFYTGFSGLVLFALVFYSYRIMTEAEGFLIRRELAAQIRQSAEQLVQWVRSGEGSGENRYALQRSGKTVLTLTVPEDLFFHKPDPARVVDTGGPVPGRELARISASASRPDVFPFAILYELEPGFTRQPEEFRSDFRMILGYGENRALLRDLRYEGRSELSTPSSSLRWEGIFWSYQDTATSRRVRSGLYLLRHTGEMELAVVLKDPVVRGFQHHPLLLELLRSLRIP